MDLAHGYAADVIALRRKQATATYLLPAEGALLWSDSLVIPAASRNKPAAGAFLNFILRPENPFPLEEDLRKAELLLPASAAGEALQQRARERIAAAVPRKPDTQGESDR